MIEAQVCVGPRKHDGCRRDETVNNNLNHYFGTENLNFGMKIILVKIQQKKDSVCQCVKGL